MEHVMIVLLAMLSLVGLALGYRSRKSNALLEARENELLKRENALAELRKKLMSDVIQSTSETVLVKQKIKKPVSKKKKVAKVKA